MSTGVGGEPVRRALEGGLPVVALNRPGPRVLAARLVIRGGSSADPAHQRGAHQLLAGLMTRGCGILDAEALADRVEGAGAALRAEANEDALTLALHCGAEDAQDLLPLLLEMVRQPILSPDQVDLERQLNLQTLQRQREDPFQQAHDQLRRLLFDGGPYGHDPLGVEEDLSALEGSQLRTLVQTLGEQGAAMVLCGDCPEGVEDLLNHTLLASPWQVHEPEALPLAPHPSPPGSIGCLEEDTEQLVLLLGTGTVAYGHPDALPLRLLQAHLGSGMSSRLFQVMREERGLAYEVGAHFPARCGPSPFVVHLSTSAERAAEASSCLLDEWLQLLNTPISQADLELALAKHRGQDAMGRQTCGQLAERVALLLSHGLPLDRMDRQLEEAGRLSPGDLQAGAQRWLGRPSLSLVGPRPALEAARQAWLRHPLSAGHPPE